MFSKFLHRYPEGGLYQLTFPPAAYKGSLFFTSSPILVISSFIEDSHGMDILISELRTNF